MVDSFRSKNRIDYDGLVYAFYVFYVYSISRSLTTKKNTYYKLHLGMAMRSLPFLLIACLMLLFMIGGAEADEPLPLYGGPYWTEVDNEPPEVGDGALEVSWNQNDVETENLDISIESTGIGFVPADVKIIVETVVTWTNNDTMTHTVTDKNSNFDSFDIAPGESFQVYFSEVGVIEYYCKYHPMMEGTINVLSDASADKQAQTSYIEVWTAESYLVFWANFSM